MFIRVTAAMAVATLPVLAGDAAPQARELSTDRPDKTESPFTVPAGRWQAEADAFSFLLDEHGTDAAVARTTGWSAAAVNLKFGVTDRLDLQFVLPAWGEQERKFTDGHRERERGWSDLTIRAKLNLFGNDRGNMAMALMPFISLPTAGGAFGSDGVEAGLIIPFAVKLPGGWNLGTMIEGDLRREDRRPTFAGIASVTLSHDITARLGGYVEWWNEWTRPGWASTFDAGLTFRVTPNVQLDAGANFGLTRSADDLTVFTGISIRY
jgi:hypothetical protein